MERDQANFKCTVCANAYYPTRDGGGMAFEDLPESWKCPVCEQPKTCMKYEDPTEEGGLDENSSRDENFKKMTAGQSVKRSSPRGAVATRILEEVRIQLEGA